MTEPGPSKWLLKNAAKYGFVVRYQEGKEKVTGYMPESWHLRYIGKEAQDIADSGLSLEEYYGFTGGDYVDKEEKVGIDIPTLKCRQTTLK